MTIDIGSQAPDDRLVYDDGSEGSLVDAQGRKRIVFFYPKAMTPGCTTEACDFRDLTGDFAAAGYDIVGVSPDPPARNAEFRRKDGLGYPLLSDEGHVVADKLGAWGTKKNYGKEYEGLIRSTFVLDENGVVTHAWRNVRAAGHVGRVAAELLGP